MKKLFFAVMAMFAMSFAACGNKTENAADVNDTIADSIEFVDSIDSVAVVDSFAIAE